MSQLGLEAALSVLLFLYLLSCGTLLTAAQTFLSVRFPDAKLGEVLASLSVYEMVRLNLQDHSARNLMCLTRNSAALPLLFACKLLE